MQAFFAALLSGFWDLIRAWQERKERDTLVSEGVQDDARIADQAAALAAAKRVDAVPTSVPASKRKGRRPTATTATEERTSQDSL